MSFGQRGGGRGGFGGDSKPKPVVVGKEYDVTVSEISRRGDGIAKIDGFVIFVVGGKQGQSAKIKVTQVSERFATGTIVASSGTSTASGGQELTEEGELAEEMEEADE